MMTHCRSYSLFLALLFQCCCVTISNGQDSTYHRDFEYYWEAIRDNFAYFEGRQTDWEKVKTIYKPRVDTVRSKAAFIHLLENANNELYNGHVYLNTNTPSSNKLIPSGADLKMIRQKDRYVIGEVRQGSGAALCGLKAGMVITGYNGIRISEAVQKFLPLSTTTYNSEMYEYAANMVLAGARDVRRNITAIVNGKEQVFAPGNVTADTGLLESRILEGNIGYIKINNTLGNNALIKTFDTTLDKLMQTRALILDLRETPNGGNTTVARGIMGRFIQAELPYQKHIYVYEEKETGIKRSTLELVSPRGSIYKSPLIVLVGYWTGSMGEGIAIGFEGMNRARVAGTKMAGLLGEIFTFQTPVLKIPFSFPCARLQYIDGRPREGCVPSITVSDQDRALETVVRSFK